MKTLRPLLLLLSLLLASCVVEPFEHASAGRELAAPAPDFYPGQECVLWHVKHYAPAGACFLVTADEWSTLATCDGTFSDNEIGKTWEPDPACSGCGRSYPTSSFEIPGGGCFQFYNCHPAGVADPIVEPCE